jgi:hypothetical protein
MNIEENQDCFKKIFGSYNAESKILYVANHKVANTSICTLLARNKFTKRKKTKINVCDLKFVFSFVRNPYDRIVSRYEQLRQKLINLDQIQNKAAAYKNIKEYFKYCKKSISLENFEFEVFVNFIVDVFDPHWEVQYIKLERELGSIYKYDFIGKYENLIHDLRTICNTININPHPFPHINQTNRNHYSNYYSSNTKKL